MELFIYCRDRFRKNLFQHHVLDLILKHVMNEMLVAKSTSPNISYDIFTELITKYENLKQNFKQSDIILEKHRIKWRDDMQYLFELGQAFKYYEKNNFYQIPCITSTQ